MTLQRVWAMPNKNTFSIKPIRELLDRYILPLNGDIVVDPFANTSEYGTITNDLNPAMPTDYHMDALEFLKMLPKNFADTVLYDPPYSFRQATECYKTYGREKLTGSVTNQKYWAECKDNIARILKPSGIAICCGWNSNGIGKKRGFSFVEILVVAHGGGKHDTIVTVERKGA